MDNRKRGLTASLARILEEVNYLKEYGQLNDSIKNYIDILDKRFDLLIRFLDQNTRMSSDGGIEITQEIYED